MILFVLELTLVVVLVVELGCKISEAKRNVGVQGEKRKEEKRSIVSNHCECDTLQMCPPVRVSQL